MIAERWHGARNALTLIVGLLLLWQIVYLMVGDVALSSPLATVRYTATLVTSDTFATHLYDTMRAFCNRVLPIRGHRAVGRFLARLRPALG
jgi:ABC-type nitrate/sulfonate/bicarbonate transport system permease component